MWSSSSTPALLLAAVAVCQIALSYTVDLTAWKGGGFGMFSTLDHGAYRGIDIIVEAPERSEAIEIPPSLEEAVARAAACPSESFLRRLAEGVVDRERRYERPVTRVKLTAWRTEFDRTTLHASEAPLRQYVYDVH